MVVGLVPWPSFARHLFVYPGRNVLSGPFTSAKRLGVWHSGILNTFKTADSAARADTLRIGYFDGTESPVVYLDSIMTWRAVGQKGDAGHTPVDLVMAIDLQRAGPAGFVGMNGLSPEPGPQTLALASPVRERSIEEFRRLDHGIEVAWAGEATQRYQVQVRRMDGQVWKDSGAPVEGGGGRCVVQLGLLEGSGVIRVIELP
jgi:hypothetical protein